MVKYGADLGDLPQVLMHDDPGIEYADLQEWQYRVQQVVGSPDLLMRDRDPEARSSESDLCRMTIGANDEPFGRKLRKQPMGHFQVRKGAIRPNEVMIGEVCHAQRRSPAGKVVPMREESERN